MNKTAQASRFYFLVISYYLYAFISSLPHAAQWWSLACFKPLCLRGNVRIGMLQFLALVTMNSGWPSKLHKAQGFTLQPKRISIEHHLLAQTSFRFWTFLNGTNEFLCAFNAQSIKNQLGWHRTAAAGNVESISNYVRQHAQQTCNQFCLKVLYKSLRSPNFVRKPALSSKFTEYLESF